MSNNKNVAIATIDLAAVVGGAVTDPSNPSTQFKAKPLRLVTGIELKKPDWKSPV